MKGQVLGFDGMSGAISAEDGSRYNFTAADWKGQSPPKPRDAVDFVPVDGAATEIYVTRGSFAMGAGATGAADLLQGESAAKARGFIATRPQAIIAVVLILASILLNFMSSPGQNGSQGVSLFGVGPAMGQMRTAMAEASQMTSALMGSGGSASASPPFSLTLLWLLGYLLWLVPLGAAFLLFREYTNARNTGLELLVGVGAIASLLYILLVKSMISSAMHAIGMPFAETAASMVSFGAGAFLIFLCGIGLIATAKGKLSRTPGL